jgi:hypothetical protein
LDGHIELQQVSALYKQQREIIYNAVLNLDKILC